MAKLNFDSAIKKIKSCDFDFDPVMVILGSLAIGTIVLLGLWAYYIPFVHRTFHEKDQFNVEVPQTIVEEFTENPAVVINNSDEVTVIDLDSLRPRHDIEETNISRR